MRILAVDDSSTMRKILRKMLVRLGYPDVVEAANGAQALEQMDGVDLVLTDWNMPEMDGLSLVEALRSHPRHGRVPIIMVTTEADREEIVTAIRAGVNDYVVKPFTPDVLLEKIERVRSQ
ncbi:MAG: chemotaxis response regulator CheY [Deferrisomatales bacterium]